MATRIQLYSYDDTTSTYVLTQTITGSDIISCDIVREYDPSGLTVPTNRGEAIITGTYALSSTNPIVKIQYSYDGGTTYADDYVFIVTSANQFETNYTKLQFTDENTGFGGISVINDLTTKNLSDFLGSYWTYDTGLSTRQVHATYEQRITTRKWYQYILLSVGCGIIQKSGGGFLVTNKRPDANSYTTISDESIFVGGQYKNTESIYKVTAYYRNQYGTYQSTYATNPDGVIEKSVAEYGFKSTHSIPEYLIADLNHKQMEVTLYNISQSLGDTIRINSETGYHIGMIIKEEINYGINKLAKVKLMLTETYGNVSYPSEDSSSSGT